MDVPAGSVDGVEMLPGVWRRTLVAGERTMLCEITLAPGAVVPMHTHPHEQIGRVLQGAIRMVIDGRERICRPGDSYVIRGGIQHMGEALDEGAVVIDVFSPPREDYR